MAESEEPEPEDTYADEPELSLGQLALMKEYLAHSSVPACNPIASDQAFAMFGNVLKKLVPPHKHMPNGCLSCETVTLYEVIMQYVAVLEATVNVINGLSRGEFGWKQFREMQPDQPPATNANMN